MSVLDAGRNDLYVGEYEVRAKSGVPPRERILNRNEFLSQAQGWHIVTPDPALAEAVRASGLSVEVLSPLSSAAVAALGLRKIQAGETVNPDQLEANYIRRTDAEMLEKIGP